MIALLSTLLGFAASSVPKLFELFQDKRDKKHELELMKYQAEMDKQRADANLEASIVQSQGAMNIAVQQSYQADIEANKELGNSWIVGFSASVRPVITYAFFALYASVKVANFWLLTHPEMPWQQALTYSQALAMIWGDEDMAIFGAVVSFWFGVRLGKGGK